MSASISKWPLPAGASAKKSPPSNVRVGPARASGRWLVVFIVFQMVCSIALLSSSLNAVRPVFRTAAFTSSLALIGLLRRSGPRHVAASLALVVLAILVVSLLNPSTNNLVAGAAHIALYAAILGPIFWVPKLDITTRTLRNALLVMWIFHATSAVVGTLQVYLPNGPFSVEADAQFDNLKIVLASGETIFRPSGLSDAPGAAAASGFYAVLFAIGFLLQAPKWWFRILLMASIFLGMFVLYLCQVRSLIVMLAICVAALLTFIGLQGKVGKVVREGATIGGLVLAAFVVAAAVGGSSTVDRLATLIEDDASSVYYQNRGYFLEETLTTLLPQYPLGAGLGRWGMIYAYFGDFSRADIWVEIQWTGWLLDGGVPMMIAYSAAVGVTVALAAQIARRRVGRAHEGLWLWAAVIFGYDLGAMALTFNYALFIGQLGLEFWLLNASLFAAAHQLTKKAEMAEAPA